MSRVTIGDILGATAPLIAEAEQQLSRSGGFLAGRTAVEVDALRFGLSISEAYERRRLMWNSALKRVTDGRF